MGEQRAQMLAEVNAERCAHQKMVKEYARLEQRYANLEEELALERADPNKIALDKSREIQADGDVNELVFKEEEEIHKLKIELAETQRERDVLASELERLRSEYKSSMTLPVPSISVNDGGVIDESPLEQLRTEKTRLIAENEELLRSNVQLATLKEIVSEEESKVGTGNVDPEKVMGKLLTTLEKTKKENEELYRKLSSHPGGPKNSGMGGMGTRSIATSPVLENARSVVSPVEVQALQQVNARITQELDQLKKERENFKRDLARIQQMKVPETAQQAIIEVAVQVEISRLSQENFDLKEKNEQLERQMKEIKATGIVSPPRTRARTDRASSLSPGSASRPRANTMDVKYSESKLVGKMAMTYAGLFRKQDGVQSPREERATGDPVI